MTNQDHAHKPSSPQGNGLIRFLIENSLLLIGGAVAALIWANLSYVPDGESSYQRFVNFDIASLWSDADAGQGAHEVPADEPPGEQPDREPPQDGGLQDGEHAEGEHAEGEHAEGEHAGGHGFTIHFLINDILMAFFFAIAAKEVWESMLPGGSLSNPRKAATPLLATFGGIAGPALVFLAGTLLTGTTAELGRGWAIPCATDIAFSYLVARFIFGSGHPAIAFLLLLAIADDAAGLVILAVFYPQEPVDPQWLLLAGGAMLLAAGMRRFRVHHHLWYLLGPGVLCWIAFYQAHVHPALGLVPIIPILPHAHTDLGFFAREELGRDDTLDEFEAFWKTPVEIFLGLFGLVNAGVAVSGLTTGTYLVLAGLLLGKPLGITGMTFLAEKVFRLEKPGEMDYRHVVTLGMIAGIGFTVALFVSVAAFQVAGPIQDAAKMGALLSFAAAPVAILIGRALGIRPEPAEAAAEDQPQAV